MSMMRIRLYYICKIHEYNIVVLAESIFNFVYNISVGMTTGCEFVCRSLKNVIVACQPFVGWRNGVARHRPVNKVSAQARWRHMFTWLPVDEPPSCRLQREWGMWRNSTVERNTATTAAMIPLTQLGYISEDVSRFSSVPGVTVKKSVFKKQWIREVRPRRRFRSVKWRLYV
jgi:hypothetical protein